MLEKLLLVTFQLMPNQPNLPPPEYYVHQYLNQKPAIVYTQASEELSHKLLREADTTAQINPVSAIELYKMVVKRGGPLKEDAIEKILNIYKSLAEKALTESEDEKDAQSIIKLALNFYNEVIQRHRNSRHLAKAYLDSGSILWRWNAPYNFDKAIKRSEEARKRGNIEQKAQASLNLGFIYLNSTYNYFSDKLQTKYTILDAKEKFKEAVNLVPNSEIAEIANNMLEVIDKIESKTKNF